MIVSPTLESGSRIIGILAINFNELIENSACEVQVLVTEVFP
jgi:hypothetical protein